MIAFYNIFLFTFAGFPVMLAVLKEERDDVEMVENLSSPYIFIPCFSFNFNSITQKVHIKRKKIEN